MSTDFVACIRNVATLGTPVLLSDTCFLLDIVRDPTRDNVRPEDKVAAAALAEALFRPSTLVAFVAEQVHTELAEHRAAVETEAAKAIHILSERLKRMDQILAAYGGSGTSVVDHLKDHGDQARNVLDRWLAASRTAVQVADVAGRAITRMNQCRTPARKGNASAKDCVVIETYLDLAVYLRAEGHTAPIVFASSNTKDYCDIPGARLKADLEAEFTRLKMAFAPNFGAAKHLLGQ
jgi:hypothetical protein